MKSCTVKRSSGFTLLELLVVVSLVMILAGIAIPQFASLRGQLQASEDIRTIAHTLSTLRGEAIRMRSPVRVSFNAEGLSWDIKNDGSEEGSFSMNESSAWVGNTPADLVFSGLGIVSGLVGQRKFTLDNRGLSLSLVVNSNGYLELLN